jgi:hypothetical protein
LVTAAGRKARGLSLSADKNSFAAQKNTAKKLIRKNVAKKIVEIMDNYPEEDICG